MLSELQKQFPFVCIQLPNHEKEAKESRTMLMATQGAQYVFYPHVFNTADAMIKALDALGPDDRQNAVVCDGLVKGHYCYLTLVGNMQHIPMERLNPDDVYKDIQEVKQEAAEWLVKNFGE